jgi:ATP-binding cassette subfamily B (MDR/TAP) protein 1
VSLIERFDDPIAGTIELDGIDLKELNASWLRDQIGLVQQEPTLFDATILENIRYGNPTATQEEVEEAARRANAYDFITAFPDQFNTYVGERGSQLSGGQKQRIAISRAILKPLQLLLLDEATSALDSESEHLMQDALDKLLEAKSQTAIVIAHRLSTLRNADRIAVIADGKVKEIGTHGELIPKPNGHFRRLSAFQSLDGGANFDIKSLMAAATKESEEKENIRDSVINEENEADWDQEIDSAEEGDRNKAMFTEKSGADIGAMCTPISCGTPIDKQKKSLPRGPIFLAVCCQLSVPAVLAKSRKQKSLAVCRVLSRVLVLAVGGLKFPFPDPH